MVTDATPRTRSPQRGPVAPVGDPGAWRNRIVGAGEEPPDQLVANPANWRTHPGPQREALRGSLAEVGWVQQVMVNRRTGSTIIAAEQLGRRCYAMEIDPRYVAVAIKRWEDFTGKTSERIDG